MEIGCYKGGSLQVWKKYFGAQVTVVGIDVMPECKSFEEDQIKVRIGSQADTAFLQSVIDEFGVPDIILDDGSHRMEHIGASFDFLYPKMPKWGVYMVEDLHTAYWPEFGGGYRAENSFVETAKNLTDSLNAKWSRGQVPVDAFARETTSISFYDSMVVFERGMNDTNAKTKFGKQA